MKRLMCVKHTALFLCKKNIIAIARPNPEGKSAQVNPNITLRWPPFRDQGREWPSVQYVLHTRLMVFLTYFRKTISCTFNKSMLKEIDTIKYQFSAFNLYGPIQEA